LRNAALHAFGTFIRTSKPEFRFGARDEVRKKAFADGFGAELDAEAAIISF
jgi:hypothetical protein